jgi:aminoglycoside phosphotransferase family enzyme
VGEALKAKMGLVSALPPVIRALLESQAYPHLPQKVELVQTQMSFVFLAGEYVYKVKKPVNLGYLDYTTLEKRHFFCRQEIELNRRLCSHAYLAVVPIVVGNDVIHVEGQGRTIEYAVKMRRLLQERMMDVLLLRGQVTPEMVAMVAEKLVDFHRKAETNDEIAAFGRSDAVRRNCDENFAQTEKYVGLTIFRAEYELIKGYTDDFIRDNNGLLEKRVREGRIRDCHGDLHAAHICFTGDACLPGPGGQVCIYDCIEFNDRFRYCDVGSELAFLAMDLDRYGQAGLSDRLVDTYVDLSHDEELLKVLGFYKCYRAYVRGKVESFKLDDPHIPEREKTKASSSAQSYFRLARSYV